MADKKVTPPLGAYPTPPQPQAPYLPSPPHQAAPQYGVAGGSPYGFVGGAAAAAAAAAQGGGQLYAPAPPYDLHHHQPINIGQQMYTPAAAMYAAAGYPGYIGYPVQYYPYYQPSIQPLRPTIMIPNGFEAAGARFDGVTAAGPLLPPAPPGVPPSPAQLAAMAGHQVLWR